MRVRIRWSFLAGFRCLLFLGAFLSTGSVIRADGGSESKGDSDDPQAREKVEVLFFVTNQDPSLDWWYRIPPNSGPVIETTRELYRGQRFLAIPFVVQYAQDKDGGFDLVYSIRQTDPEGESKEILTDVEFRASSPASNVLLPLPKYPGGYYEEEDALGAYSFSVTLRDRLADKEVSTEAGFTLVEWEAPEPLDSMEAISKGTTEFYRKHDPDWLFAALTSPELRMEQERTPTGFNSAMLGFFQAAFASNSFLLPHLDTVFADAGESTRRHILLVRALLDEPRLPGDELTEEERVFQESWYSQDIPDPYETLLFPDHLDWLWGEFFATGRYAPVRRLIDVLSLASYKKNADEALENRKIPEGREAELDFWRGMTFKAGVWSLGANCKRHKLVRQYCAWVLQNEDLPERDAALLQAILSNAVREDQDSSD